MNARVVDTNVPVVANGRAEQAGPECAIACVNALERLKNDEKILIDDKGLILEEYGRNLSFAGQPGVGDAFFKWVWSNQANTDRCVTVEIHFRNENLLEFIEFPDDERLASFDRSDRKFVATALASQLNPTVLNAVDSDWWDHRMALQENGVHVIFLCPGQFE